MKISVVTPAVNEAQNLECRIRELREQDAPWEWIVVDGGSTDDSVAVARACGAAIVHSERGRGPQMNAGAAQASGSVLLFLHADTALPPNAFAHVRAALLDPNVVGGNFTFAFDDPSFAGRLLASVYALKRALFRVWYGDSVIFVRTTTFRQLGGFAAFPIMEDAHFVERLQRAGRTRRLAAIATTSSRRYRGRVVATIVRWTAIFALYKLGVSPHRLARLYPPHRATEAERRAGAASRADAESAEAPPTTAPSARG